MPSNLADVRMSDRFTHRIDVHPRQWSLKRPPHIYKLILVHENKPVRCSHHPFIEDVERSIREFVEMFPDGDWEVYDYEENRGDR
ncbi:MAG: hypothetical protein AAFV28_06680 [Cyanobacteria bacterium J06635_13]